MATRWTQPGSRRYAAAAGVVLFFSGLTFAHYYLLVPVDPLVPVVTADIEPDIYRCIDEANTELDRREVSDTLTVEDARAEIELACGERAAADGTTYYLETVERSTEVTRTVTHEVRGSTELRVSEADADVLVFRSDLSGSCQTNCGGGSDTFSSPTLFDDYSGFAFQGEPGAIAVNDDWATTTYDYIPQFAPTIGTLPTPTGDPALPGSSQVSPNAADEYLVVDASGISTALNDNTYQYLFVAKGTDVCSMANQSLTSSGTGTETDQRYIIWWDPDNPSNVQDIKPWNLSAGDKACMPLILASGTGTGWVNIIGFEFERVGQCTDGVHDLLFYRNEVTGFASHALSCFEDGGATPNNITVFESYFHDSVQADGGGDRHGVLWNACDDCKFISNEGHEIAGDMIQIDGDSTGWIVEDNDYYVTVEYDGSGNQVADGDYHAGEGFLDVKEVGDGTESGVGRAYGNRCWNTRATDETAQGTSGSGACIRLSVESIKDYVDLRWNVVEDSTDNCIDMRSGETVASQNISAVRNICSDIRAAVSNSYPLYPTIEETESYLNTAHNSLNATGLTIFFQSDSGTLNTHDWMGGLLIDTGSWNSTSALGTSAFVGYNAYGGTYTTFSKEYSLGTENTKAALNMGDFTYSRKSLTTEETSTITGIVPTSSTPSAVRTLVPTSGADQIGSRSGIGVDDAF